MAKQLEFNMVHAFREGFSQGCGRVSSYQQSKLSTIDERDYGLTNSGHWLY